MTFASIPFLFYFLPVFLALYFASPFKNTALLLGSFIFYAWGEPVYILALLASVTVNHVIGRTLARQEDGQGRRLLWAGVAFNLAMLGWFKYAGFVAHVLSVGVALVGGPDDVFTLHTHLPLGVSFYSFQAISFLIDLNRKDAPPPRRWADTALFIAMFPQLIAGPIVRYKTIAAQLISRTHSLTKFADGARQFVLGLAQKVLLANTFAAVTDAAFDAPGDLTWGAAWIGLVCYAMQIFFDFSGYSNMAIGMGRMFGFDLPQNFNFPYVAQSVTEFWRRWHITLSQWFRDYVYIPLGGSRAGAFRTAINLWVVFLLCGLWHGAAFAFVVWGAYHGLLLVLERGAFGRALAAAPRVVRHFYLLVAVTLGWLPFRAESLHGAADYMGALVRFDGGVVGVRGIAPDGLWAVLAVGAVAALWPLVGESARGVARRIEAWRSAGTASHARGVGRWPATVAAVRFSAGQVALAGLLVLSGAALAAGTYNPFIYFRF